MSDKRKYGPDGSVPNAKRKRAGNNGKWTTSHQKERAGKAQSVIEPFRQAGMWATCARGMERKAGKEVDALYQKYAKSMFGVDVESVAFRKYVDAARESDNAEAAAKGEAEEAEKDGAGADDIEAQIQKELAAMKQPPASESEHLVRFDMGFECVLFTRFNAPLDPVAMARQICVNTKREADAAALAQETAIRAKQAAEPVVRSCKYVNRLTPVSCMGKASESGVRAVGRKVLGPHFRLSASAADEEADEADDGEEEPLGEAVASNAGAERAPHTFSVRVNIRRHNTFVSRSLIEHVAALIDQEHHRVDLVKPDKVVLVEVFKHHLGMSVVDGSWEQELRKYNVTAIYNQARTDAIKALDEAQSSETAAADTTEAEK